MICPYCRADLDDEPPLGDLADEPTRRLMCCTSCETRVHASCAQHHGRCVTFGCGHTDFRFVTGPAPERRVRPRVPAPARVGSRRARRESVVAEAPALAAPLPGWVPQEDIPLFLIALVGLARLLIA
ncbi:MAG: hypothetical protein AB7N76_14870 [Planctomycetota bacterium]